MFQIDSAAIFTSIMVLLAPLCLELTRDILGHIRSFLLDLWERVKRRLFPRVSLVISYVISDSNIRTAPEHSASVTTMTDIFEYLTVAGVISSSSKLITNKKSRGNKVDPHLTVKPLSSVKHAGLTFDFSQEEQAAPPHGGDGGASNQMRLEISGQSFMAIKTFVNKCTQAAIDRDRVTKKPRMYIQVDAPTPKFLRFKINISTTFDNIFMPNKQELINIVNNLRDGNRRKLAMLLYGRPGCGKTSLIKAIAAHLGYDVVIVKLSHMTCDTDILQVLHSRDIFTQNGGCYTTSQKTIYVFEDIDAETDTIHARVDGKAPAPLLSSNKEGGAAPRSRTTDDIGSKSDAYNSGHNYNSGNNFKFKYGVTLSGVLNALDGILEIHKSLIILTSNHPEKLDPALLRPGRTDYKIELREMTAECADQLIRSYFSQSLVLHDHEITPAALHELLKDAPNIEWLADHVAGVIGRDVEITRPISPRR